jgi:hypothetical protein
MAEFAQLDAGRVQSRVILMPSPTAWPLFLAFGAALMFAGPVTNLIITAVGVLVAMVAGAGWFRQVFPHEQHTEVVVRSSPVVIETVRRSVDRVYVGHLHRAYLPLETYPVLSGIKGGIGGGIAMVIPALIYGLIAQHSIWYPINLLGGAGVANWRNPTTADIAAFHWQGLAVASVIHTATCLLVGLLYGAMLPMMSRRPIVLGGVVAPLLWTGLLYSSINSINPVLAERISWSWFLVSQFTFGIVAGLIVSRAERIPTAQSLPFSTRIGLQTPGIMRELDDDQEKW